MTAYETSASGSMRNSSPAFDFVKGFITGQIALLSLLFFIVRFLFFRSIGPVSSSSNCIRIESSSIHSSASKKKFKLNDNNIPSNSISSLSDMALLERLFGIDQHSIKQQALKSGAKEVIISEESGKWLTFILAKLVFDPLCVHVQQNSSQISAVLENQIKAITTKIPSMKHLNSFQIKSLELGNSSPIIDSYQLIYDSESESCLFRLKYSWHNVFALEVESALTLVNLIVLPFSVSVKLKRLQFTLQLQSSKIDDELEISCLSDDYLLIDLEVSSLVGHRTKLKDLPKIKNTLVEIIKKILIDSIISPQSLKIRVPKIYENFNWSCDQQNYETPEFIDFSNLEYNANQSDDFETDHISCERSLISDESEPMNIFMDSRYDDEFNEFDLVSEPLLEIK